MFVLYTKDPVKSLQDQNMKQEKKIEAMRVFLVSTQMEMVSKRTGRLQDGVIWQRRHSPRYMLSAALEDAIVHEIKLHARSIPIYNEKHVVGFDDFVVPYARLQRKTFGVIQDQTAWMLYRQARMGHRYRVESSIIVFPIFVSVPFVRQSRFRRESPPAHLKNSDKQQRMDPEHTRRHREPHDLPRHPGSVAEVVGIREGSDTGVEPDRALDRQVGKDPISAGKRSGVPQQEVDKARNAGLPPPHLEVVEPEIVVVFEPRDVDPVVEYDTYAAELE